MAVAPPARGELWPLADSLEELGQLATTAGAQVIDIVTQRGSPTATYYLGKGKFQELRDTVVELGCDVVIFDDELTPNQARNLERELQVKVIDRTALILDIFAGHAQTREGALQVRLAQQEYLLPRLAGQWSHLERLGGGIGTRGPGETQIETDRRLIRRSIQKLKAQLEEVRQRRSLYRDRRKVVGVPTVSIVGYTNAGKSTLLNALSGASVRVQDQPFSTLDPVTRRIVLPDGRPALLTDTVGFIQKLPPRIIAAFRATLEELQAADLLLHIVDITHHNAAQQTQEVTSILEELELGNLPTLLVLNKVDLLAPPGDADTADGAPLGIPEGSPWSVAVSATRGWGLTELLQQITAALNSVDPWESAGQGTQR